MSMHIENYVHEFNWKNVETMDCENSNDAIELLRGWYLDHSAINGFRSDLPTHSEKIKPRVNKTKRLT